MSRPLYYTFGNHMHWVDMQWLWGYDVLPSCVADMRRLIEETGARGNVNFDAIGYEKMAAECPDALADLRAMVEAGWVEPVGCTYGQPYGLFHGGESNVRQLTYGARATRRLLGVRPRTFWEEEFYWYPQLPQVLGRCGYDGACLFFQWTWHTPEVPLERASHIWWEGIDGSRIPALPRNELNVHQWPEDFDGLLEQGLIDDLERPVVVQWLELMPSRDWMCRSDVLLPRLSELMRDSRFDVRTRTMGEVIDELFSEGAEGENDQAMAPVRRYAPDDVWHGMTLGKNGDAHPRTSRSVETLILAAESAASLAGLFGRPYPSWDVYPTWELDEAWRELLVAQHHDNHACEGLCGFVGHQQMERARLAAGEVESRTMSLIHERAGEKMIANPLGWTTIMRGAMDEQYRELRVPPFGVAAASCSEPSTWGVEMMDAGEAIEAFWPGVHARIDVHTLAVLEISNRVFPAGVIGHDGIRILDADGAFLDEADERPSASGGDVTMGQHVAGAVTFRGDDRCDGLFMEFFANQLPMPAPGLAGSQRLDVPVAFEVASIVADAPLSADVVEGSGPVRRKYPSGDWMTSEQWFEQLDQAITSHSFIDLLRDDGSGLLIAHAASQQCFRTPRGVSFVINAYDPWDEARYDPRQRDALGFLFVPHGPITHADRKRIAMQLASEHFVSIANAPWGLSEHDMGRAVGGGGTGPGDPLPRAFGLVDLDDAPGVILHAVHRQSAKAGEHLADWAGHELARRSDGACTHPYVLRLVEWNGEPAEAVLTFPGEVAACAKCNLMGEVGAHVGGGNDTAWLDVEPGEAPWWGEGLGLSWSRVRVPLKPREIATVMADLVMGRKRWRDLDARREVWAQVHNVNMEATRRGDVS